MLERVAWGKRRSTDGNIEDRLGLIEHSIDVAAVLESLVAVPLIRRRLETLAKTRLTESLVARLAVLAFLHDVGKASVGFQSKSIEEAMRPSWLAKAKIDFNQCGHTRVVAPLFFNSKIKSKIKDRFPLAEMVQWGEPLPDLWLAAISHHGTPIVATELRSAREKYWHKLWSPADSYDPMDAISTLGECAQEWFPAAWRDGPNLPGDLTARPREGRPPATPPTRGWTRYRPNFGRPPIGYPAYAGMDPGLLPSGIIRQRLPRLRGDGPNKAKGQNVAFQATPPTRGWTHELGQLCGRSAGYPAYAGMDR